MSNTLFGKRGEEAVFNWLRNKGLEVHKSDYHCPYDLTANGWRVEVKRSGPTRSGVWYFNVHRHGKLNEDSVDFYIFCLDDVPFSRKTLYVIAPSPVKAKTVGFTFRTLITNHAKLVGNWKVLQIPKKDVGGVSL